MLPLDKSGAFESEFGFGVADGHFDLPTASISVHHIPGIVIAADGLGGEQIPGRLVFAASHNQPQGLTMNVVEDLEGDDANFALTASAALCDRSPGSAAN